MLVWLPTMEVFDMLIVKGYKCAETNIIEVEELVQKLREMVCIQGAKIYTGLLANEIEMLVDEIALNVTQRPQTSIFNAAKQALDQKISNATGRNLLLPYNFGIQLAVYTYKGSVYIGMNTNNERLVEAMKRAPAGLADFSVRDDAPDTSEMKSRETVWNEIMGIYSGVERKPLVYQFLACEGANPSWKKISEKFHSRTERAETRIRYQQTNHLLNMIGMNQQIPPHKLMPYIDEAFSYLDDKAIRADAERMMPQAMQTIVNITEEMVMLDPSAPAPNTLPQP